MARNLQLGTVALQDLGCEVVIGVVVREVGLDGSAMAIVGVRR